MSKKIEQEIEQMAENLEKSQTEEAEQLEKSLEQTIIELGPEGLRKALPTLSVEEKQLLSAKLEEMKKAVSMDSEYQAKYVQGNINDTILQEDKADDDQDEKLVKPEAAKQNHQGTPTEGWEGQVIKSNEELLELIKGDEDMMYKMVYKMCDKGMDRDKMMKMCMAKGMDEGKVSSMIDRAMKEHKQKMHKSEEVVEKADKKMLKEEEQLSDTDKATEGKPRGDKKRPKELKVDEENKAAQDKVDDLGQACKEPTKMKKSEELAKGDAKMWAKKILGEGMTVDEAMKEAPEEMRDDILKELRKMKEAKKGMKKSVPWSGENALLKANTGGRNFHYSVNKLYDELEKAMQVQPEEELKKSESEEDINDIIAKGADITQKDIEVYSGLKKSLEAQTGSLVKSFEDNEIAQALGLTEEEAKKILGE